MNPYDERARVEIQEYRTRKPSRRVRELVPGPVRERGARLLEAGKEKVVRRLEDVPGADQVEAALRAAAEGVARTIATTASASVATPLILRRYRRRGFVVSRIEDIRALELEASDGIFPRRKRLAYIGGVMATGAWAGVATTAGEVEGVVGGVAGVGAGAAPGAATVIGAFAADAAATLLAATRLVAETAALYGYDPTDPAEQLYMTGVLGAATAGTEAGKLTAQRELHQLAQALARNATWTNLNKNRIAQVVAKVYERLGYRLSKRQLGKAVPALGIVVGAGANATLMHRVADEAYFSYRERRLGDRYGDDGLGGVPVPPTPPPSGFPGPTAGVGGDYVDADAEDEETLAIVELTEAAIEEEAAEKPGDDGSSEPAGG